MLVRLHTRYASTSGCHQPGDVVDLPADEARQLIDGRYAEPCRERVETTSRPAVREVAETADVPADEADEQAKPKVSGVAARPKGNARKG